MKIIILVPFLFIHFITLSQKNNNGKYNAIRKDVNSIYNIHFENIHDHLVSMENYIGKRMLIFEFSAIAPDRKFMNAIDSIFQLKKDSLEVIGVPVNNTDTAISKTQLLKFLNDSTHVSYIISEIGAGKKSAKENQQKLLRWLSNMSSNKHFNKEIVEDGQIFIISSSGELYASLNKKIIHHPLLKQILAKQP